MTILKKLRFLLVALFVLSCGHVPSTQEKSKLETVQKKLAEGYPSRVIDAHSHFTAGEGTRETQPSPDMEKAFQEANVVAAVVHLPRDVQHSEQIVVDRKKAKFKMAICAAAVPKGNIVKIEHGLKNGEYQCLKVYLGYISKYASDPVYIPYYRLAEKYGVPVVFHTGDTYDKKAHIKYAEPLQIDDIALQFPKVNFVIAHMGNPWLQSAAEVVYKNDNVFVDISALMLGDVSRANPEQVEELAIKPIRWFWHYVENPKKMLFGSDWPLMEIKPYVEVVMKAIPKEHWDAVFYDNAAELFKLGK